MKRILFIVSFLVMVLNASAVPSIKNKADKDFYEALTNLVLEYEAKLYFRDCLLLGFYSLKDENNKIDLGKNATNVKSGFYGCLESAEKKQRLIAKSMNDELKSNGSLTLNLSFRLTDEARKEIFKDIIELLENMGIEMINPSRAFE